MSRQVRQPMQPHVPAPPVMINGAVRPLGRGQQMQDLAEARRQQQIELNVKATLFAEKQKQKEDEKRQKKIAQWEKMSGLGPGYKLGGTEETAPRQFDRVEQVRHQAMEAARWRMQYEHDNRAAQLVLRPPENNGVTQEQKNIQEREEAKRQKRIADWERMNPGQAGGQRLGHYTGVGQPGCNPGAEETITEPRIAPRGSRQFEWGPPAVTTAQSQPVIRVRAVVTDSREIAATLEPESDGAAEQARHEAMKAARLRMQQEHNSRAAQHVTENAGVSPEQKKMQEREEAKRQKRIADWERMHPGEAGGQRLGYYTEGGQLGGNPGKSLTTVAPGADETEPEPCEASRGRMQFERNPSATTDQSQPLGQQRAVASNSIETAVAPEQGDDADGWEISEEAKRAAMRVARLRMQSSLDQKLAKQRDEQDSSEKQQQQTPPQSKPSRLAAKFDKLNL